MEALLVTGSRRWNDPAAVEQVVCAYEFVVVGDARGADQHAREAAKKHDCMCKVFTADWAAEPRRAGFLRNVEMVEFCMQLGWDGILVHCHAFWDGSSRGTQHCAQAAAEAGIPVTWHLHEHT